MLHRTLQAAVSAELAAKMVFLAGPRQVGKTTLAQAVLAQCGAGGYLSWDRREDRRQILASRWPDGLVVLDEIHKFRHWRRWIKGEHDAHQERVRFLVTGSARLDVYRRGGDSLQGRYQLHRLHPLSVGELAGRATPPEPQRPLEIPVRGDQEVLLQLLQYGAFPEPFLAHSERASRRWRANRLERFFREDLRDLERVQELSALEVLADMLAERVGSPLSINALREDLEVSHKAVARWIEVFERLYLVFRVPPYTSTAVRGLRKMPKVYLWEHTAINDPGARLENLVALHLLKLCHALRDQAGWRADLFYLRDVTGREVDFLVTIERRPWLAVEVKVSGQGCTPGLRYYCDRLSIPHPYQVALDGTRDFVDQGVRCLPASRFLAALA